MIRLRICLHAVAASLSEVLGARLSVLKVRCSVFTHQVRCIFCTQGHRPLLANLSTSPVIPINLALQRSHRLEGFRLVLAAVADGGRSWLKKGQSRHLMDLESLASSMVAWRGVSIWREVYDKYATYILLSR